MGALTAYVQERCAARYAPRSAIAVLLLKSRARVMRPLLDRKRHSPKIISAACQSPSQRGQRSPACFSLSPGRPGGDVRW
ncbi:hypothetical protein BN2476_1240027 [Paraburkholderia piptadeniae]|uniref:Uncharacterized protein n=1 Tax=Paraburkholderia piptadeniae TaxID=1701573 RepID=A0A1N7SVR5_9BURK|nr:hypothetical protein BN2476_1240027 [Paraburkholderia piptadeniae]